ncbi:MAG TPA: ABC transporter ATP-binding protein [Candidatus Saccharimonadales bacterium]
MEDPNHAVEVRGINKIFRVPHEKVSSLKGHATRLFRNAPAKKYHVLRDISFSINKGEFFSVIGANGSGKSTLLKLLAGIYEPSSGAIMHDGTLTTMIELGVGFNFELSGRDNIFLNAALFGMTKNEVEAVYDKIVGFAEIEEFIDQKVKNYSSGMQVRLAFAIAIQAKADIIVVDEVLAVGDTNFQQKCFDVFRELKGMGKTIIFVSHDLQAVQDFSDRVLLLQHGEQIGIFKPLRAIEKYNELSRAELEHAETEMVEEETEEPKIDKSKPHILGVELLDANGKPTKNLSRGSACRVALTIANPVLEPIEVGISIQRNDGIYCFGTNTYIEHLTVPVHEKHTITMHIKDVPLQKGAYYIIAGVFGKSLRPIYELQLKAKSFRILQDDRVEGVVALDRKWEL